MHALLKAVPVLKVLRRQGAIDILLNQRFEGDFRTIVQKYPGVFENREA